MKITKIKKQNIATTIKQNHIICPLNNYKTIENNKKNSINLPSSKTLNNKRRSISVAEKNILNETKTKNNFSFDNSLELDYLNFSKIDLFKLNESFEEDIFTPNNNKRKNRIVEDRYQNSDSTMNGNSTIIKNEKNIFDNQTLITNEKDYIINTPSTMCNYYDQSTNKKNKINNNLSEKYNNINDEIKKNLAQYYNKNSEQKENYDPNNTKKKNEQEFSVKCPNVKLNNEKPTTKYLTPNIKTNSIIINNNKTNKNKEIKTTNSQNKVNKIIDKNINELNVNKKYSKSNEKIQSKNINKSSLKDTKDEIKQNNISNFDKISVNSNKGKTKKQKPLNLCYNQKKYDSYFITPRSINKKDVKHLSSTKCTKININTGNIIRNKSFNTNKNNKDNNIKNNLIYMNNNETKNPDNNPNYKIMKELINDFEINTKNINKTTPKNNIKNRKEINSSKKDIIKVNLKNNTKSSSNLAKTQKNFFIKNKNQFFYPFNHNTNYQNSKLKSEIKQPFNIYKNIKIKDGKNSMFSPMTKNNPSSINYEEQKILTEQNFFSHKMDEATPKNYKIQKFESVPFTAMVKKIFIGSSKKDNLIKFDSSMKKKQNQKTKTEQMKCIFKPKTQSDLKNYDKLFGLGGGDYGNDKHVKQKLLDRMNKATNNWHYIFMGNKNKKILDDGISNIKNYNRDKEHIDYFNKNENIISDGSEKEDEY